MTEELTLLQDLVENKLLKAHKNCPDVDKQPRYHVSYEKLRKCIVYQLYQVFINLDINVAVTADTPHSNSVFMELLGECLNKHKAECYHYIYDLHPWDDVVKKINEIFPKVEALREEYIYESNQERIANQLMTFAQSSMDNNMYEERKEIQATA